MTRALVLLAVACAVRTSALIAQPLSIATGIATLKTVGVDGSGRRVDDGFAVSAEGRFQYRRFTFGAALTEGRLNRGPTLREYAEGRLQIGFLVRDAFELTAGPVVRVLIDEDALTRWVHWRAGAEVSAPMPASPFTVHLGGWAATGSRSGLSRAYGRATGALVGLRWRQGPIGARLDYGLEELQFAGPERLTVERLALRLELMRGRGADDATFE